jgi:nucleoside-triphosphatase THEP1
MAKALSVTALLSKRMKLLDFTGRFKDLIGCPELTGSWIIWGPSGSGKTTFVLELCKYLTEFGRVGYDSLEEGASQSMKLAFQRVNMTQVKRKLILLDREPLEELKVRLRKKKAPQIAVIDSIQYAQLSYQQYLELIKEFPNTLFLMISHAEGKEPDGRVAKKIRYDANVKIRVEGYVAFATSRYGDGNSKPYVIWPEMAKQYHGTDEF